MKIRPIILSGGAGTRLWPVSRQRYPKQFTLLSGDKSLFTRTLERVADRKQFAAPYIVGNSEHKFLILDSLDNLKIRDATILLEPLSRNTAAAAIAAAIAEDDPECLHLVMPSDHIIEDGKKFCELVDAAQVAARNHFVLFGIKPEWPETGFGYIMPGDNPGNSIIQKIQRFCEKPDSATAQKFIEQGALWNSGIFLYAPQTLKVETTKLAPEQLKHCEEAFNQAQSHENCYTLSTEAYKKLGDHPFDRLIMEKTDKGAVVPCQMGWSDLGSWQTLWQVAKKNEASNAVEGQVVTRDVKNSYIRSYGPAVAVLGMEDVAVVAMKDSVLVAPLNRSQDIKTLAAEVGEVDDNLTVDHPRVVRPWGTFEGVARGAGFQVKHITVLPGRALSLQMHHHRAEHWIVVAGTAKVECDGEEKILHANQSAYIPQGATHRLSNPGIINLELIEVQSGAYLGEDDIVRFEDRYGRTSDEADAQPLQKTKKNA